MAPAAYGHLRSSLLSFVLTTASFAASSIDLWKVGFHQTLNEHLFALNFNVVQFHGHHQAISLSRVKALGSQDISLLIAWHRYYSIGNALLKDDLCPCLARTFQLRIFAGALALIWLGYDCQRRVAKPWNIILETSRARWDIEGQFQLSARILLRPLSNGMCNIEVSHYLPRNCLSVPHSFKIPQNESSQALSKDNVSLVGRHRFFSSRSFFGIQSSIEEIWSWNTRRKSQRFCIW